MAADKEWIDPGERIYLDRMIRDENGAYEARFRIDDKTVVMRSDDKVHCEDCARGDDDSWPAGKIWCNKLGRYMDRNGFCSFGKEKEK